MKKDTTILLFPLVAFTFFINGTNELTLGWIYFTYSIKF